jgi:hypothetical protein
MLVTIPILMPHRRTQLADLQKMYDDARIISESKTSSASEVAAVCISKPYGIPLPEPSLHTTPSSGPLDSHSLDSSSEV